MVKSVFFWFVVWLLIGAALAFAPLAHAACISGCATSPSLVSAAAPAAAPAPAASVSDSLTADFAAATIEACSPVSATDATPIDPPACLCNQFILAVLPALKPDDSMIKGPVSAAERIRIIKIRSQAGDFKQKFQMACGPLVMSIRDDILTVSALIAQLVK